MTPPALILMLTRNDVTVPRARDVYRELSTVDVQYVGFKDIGLTPSELSDLVEAIHADGRSAVLEVVSASPAAEVAAARTAVDLGIDMLIGGTRPAAVLPILEASDVRYYPYVGEIVGHPCELEGRPDEIATATRRALAAGAHGVNLLAFRYRDGDPATLIHAVSAAADRRVIVAGSVSSPTTVRMLAEAGVFAFTVGAAAMERTFAGRKRLDEEVRAVLDALRPWAAG